MTAAERDRRTDTLRPRSTETTSLPENDNDQVQFLPTVVMPLTAADPAEPAPDEFAADQRTIFRIEDLTAEIGWLLVAAGVFGVIVPAAVGIPFLLAGAVVVTPGGPKLLSRWAGNNPPKIVHHAMKQIGRFLDDLERRYPRQTKTLP
jgi:hypothetical protein